MHPNPFCKSRPDFRRLYIFGAGGFGREVAWLAEQIWDRGIEIHFVVDDSKYLKVSVNGIPVSLLSDVTPDSHARYVIALGEPAHRERLTSVFAAARHQPAVLVHPRAEMSRWVEIGSGTVICANCIVTCNVSIGAHVQINLDCTIGHDVHIGDFATLSPGVNVSGNVHIGRGVFVGTNASFVNGDPGRPLVIGDGAVIAAGACVTKDVPARTLVAGVPALVKKQW